MKSMLLAGSAIILTMGAFEAHAQTPPASNAIQEVVVTAQRREERLTDVPISITALSGESLAKAGVGTTQDLTLVTPGLFWARSTAFSQPTIRGIGTRNAGAGDEPNIATYIDGVYQPEQTATILELANVERIEVLKGPQGTLFGRNATGGAINIITQRPTFDVRAKSSVSVGSFGYFKASSTLSGPIVADKLAVALSGVVSGDNGYIRNTYLNARQGKHKGLAFRAKFLFTPTENLEFQLNGLYSEISDNVTLSGQGFQGSLQARRSANPTNVPLSILIPLATRTTATEFIPYNRTDLELVDLHANWDLGFMNLSGLVAYGETRTKHKSDSDLSPLLLATQDRNLPGQYWVEQAVATSTGDGPISWLLGAEGFQGKGSGRVISNGTYTTGTQRTRSASAFGEVTWEVFDKLFLTGGLRYTDDKKTSYFFPTTFALAAPAKSSNVVPRLVVRYKPSETSSVYASYTEGFKTGVFNVTSAAGATSATRPEQVKSYEIGGKAQLGSMLQVSAAVFRYQYTDLQVSIQTQDAAGRLQTVLQNAPEAIIRGAEFSGEFRPFRGLTLTTGVSLLHPEITNFTNATVVLPCLVSPVASTAARACLPAGQPGLPAGGVNASLDVTGKDLLRAPRYTVNLGATYSFDLAGGEMSLNTSVYLSDKYFVEISNRVAQEPYSVINASATWTAPSDMWSIGVFGQNLGDDKYFAANTISVFSDTVAYAKPRWYGVTVGLKY